MSASSSELATALRHHQSGDLQTAERIYRKILQADPKNAGALHLLALVELQRGRSGEAAGLLSRAVALDNSNAAIHNHLGVAYAHSEQLEAAQASFRRALEIEPALPDAHYNIGNILLRLKKVDEAVASYQQAVRLRPNFAEAHYNLGNALRDQGELDEAITNYERAIKIKPSYTNARKNLVSLLEQRGDQLRNQGQHPEAEARYRRAIELKPDSAPAHVLLGMALAAQSKYDAAIACYQRALAIRPDFAEAYVNLGLSLQARGNIDGAIVNYEQAIKIRPTLAGAHGNLGNARQRQGQYAAALASYAEALRLEPDLAEAYLNRGKVFSNLGRYDDAVASYREVLRLDPNDADAHYGIGNIRRYEDKLDEAQECYAEAIRLDPNHAEAHASRGMAWIRSGDFERGWPEYEWRWRCKDFKVTDVPYPRWDGSPLDGRTTLIRAEQGLGDTCQFIRYTALVRQRGGKLVVACPKPLLHILRSCPSIDRLVPEGDPLPEFDAYAPLLSLPGILRTRPETVPADMPYLFAEPELLQKWRQVLEELDGFKIGISWCVNPTHDHIHDAHRRRSFPLAQLKPLARLDGLRLISLQKFQGTEEVAKVASDFSVTELGPNFDEAAGAFMDTAAVMKCLDLVVCCDSAIGHLAGALGVPVWLAMPFTSDWRWLKGRNDTPWYPAHRLFRQPRPGDWSAVFQEMRAALEEKLNAQRTPPG